MQSYDLVIVGTGFASSFFLLRFLESHKTCKVLVLERGKMEDHAWRIKNRHNTDFSGVLSQTPFASTYINETPEKPWVYTPSFGGSSNCWWAHTPRLLPNDFVMHSRYGVGRDWPISYQDLDPYYAQAEAIMGVAGDHTNSPYPVATPYPLPPHRPNSFDRLMMQKFPGLFVPLPTARPSRNFNNRPACCNNGVCNLCPIDSKFTILNSLSSLYTDPRVTLSLDSQALSLNIDNGLANSVRFTKSGEEQGASSRLFALGANPIFNAHILLNSGVENEFLGKNLSEQAGLLCTIDLAGIDSLDGSTTCSALGYMLYDGPERSQSAGCLIESLNLPRIRLIRKRYRQRAIFKFVFEDLPQAENKVLLGRSEAKPAVTFKGFSEYTLKGIERVKRELPQILAGLPIEQIEYNEELNPSEGHILGTTPMGTDRTNSVVDKFQILHQVRNVLALGGSSFPTITPANPTLTISALSLWSANYISNNYKES